MSTAMAVAVGVLAACEGSTVARSQPPRSAPPGSGVVPPSEWAVASASTPPTCADLGNAKVRGATTPYTSSVTLRNGWWFAPDGHIYLYVDKACAVGALDGAARPVTVGWLVRQAAGYAY